MKLFGMAIVCISLSASLSHAALGEKSTTVQADSAKMKATSQKLSEANYTVHETVVDGTTIREYANSEGLVFAVSWRGVIKPDLEALFGSYYKEYKDGLDAVPKQQGKRSVSFQTSRMVIKRGGHMRDPRGFANVPSLTPQGLDLGELE